MNTVTSHEVWLAREHVMHSLGVKNVTIEIPVENSL
jgi:hypothetical protein